MARSTESVDISKYLSFPKICQIEFDGTPKTLYEAQDTALQNTEILKTYAHKISEQEYVKRTMKRLNQELSPFKDESTKDPYFVREMWEQYTKAINFEEATQERRIQREPEKVLSYLKNMELGAQDPDAKTITGWANGEIAQDDEKMKTYFIKKFQQKRL